MRYAVVLLSLLLLLPARARSRVVTDTCSHSLQGIVASCCAHMRSEPRHGSEMVSQAIMGTPVGILGQEGEWYKIETPEGYTGWMHSLSLATKTPDEMRLWRDSYRYIYTCMQGYAYDTCRMDACPMSDLVLGCILQSSGRRMNGFIEVFTPDGRKGYVPANEVADLSAWAHQTPDTDRLEKEACMMTGTTYLWGGTSVKGVDCSGFTKMLYFSQGIILLRDASQQATAGEPLDTIASQAHYRKGDLLFFGNAQGRINHVVLYLGDGRYIQCAGRVKTNSLLPTDPLYEPRQILAARRIITATGTPGVMRVSKHPWYFNQ